MPLKHLRVCTHCQHTRWAPCSVACRIPNDTDPQSWQENMQYGAGTILRADGVAKR